MKRGSLFVASTGSGPPRAPQLSWQIPSYSDGRPGMLLESQQNSGCGFTVVLSTGNNPLLNLLPPPGIPRVAFSSLKAAFTLRPVFTNASAPGRQTLTFSFAPTWHTGVGRVGGSVPGTEAGALIGVAHIPLPGSTLHTPHWVSLPPGNLLRLTGPVGLWSGRSWCSRVSVPDSLGDVPSPSWETGRHVLPSPGHKCRSCAELLRADVQLQFHNLGVASSPFYNMFPDTNVI